MNETLIPKLLILRFSKRYRPIVRKFYYSRGVPYAHMVQENTKRRQFVKGVSVMGLTGVVAGCTGGGDGGDGDDGGSTGNGDGRSGDEFEVKITQAQTPDTIDPHNHATGSVKQIALCCYDQLLRLDPSTGDVMPVLAESLPDRPEPTRLEFTLREGPTFTNGDPVTSEDVRYTLLRIIDNDFGGLASPRQENIKMINDVEVIDDRRFDVLLDTPDPIIIGRLGNIGAVMHKGWAEEHDSAHIAQNTMGTGPYTVEEFNSTSHIRLSRKDEYWGEQTDAESLQMPDPTTLTWTWASEASTRVNQLVAGETDAINAVPPQEIGRIEEADDVRVTVVPTDRPMFVSMNTMREPFDSKTFRQAMNHAVDKQSIVDNVLSGLVEEPIAQITPDYWFGHNPDLEPYEYDPETAAEMVDESGYAGAEFQIMTAPGAYTKSVEVVTAVVDHIDQLPNVSCSVDQVEYQIWSDSISGPLDAHPDAYFLGWGSGPPDTVVKMKPFQCGQVDPGYSTYCDQELQSRIEEAQSMTDRDERRKHLEDLNAYFHEQAPCIFLYRNPGIFASSTRLNWEGSPDESIKYYDLNRA